jgi:predicted HTH domain antitoxin
MTGAELLQIIEEAAREGVTKLDLSGKDLTALPPEIAKATGLSEEELLLEIVIMLFQQDKLSLGKASQIIGMSQLKFQRLLASRGICIHYDVPEFQEDLKHLQEIGWL